MIENKTSRGATTKKDVMDMIEAVQNRCFKESDMDAYLMVEHKAKLLSETSDLHATWTEGATDIMLHIRIKK